MPIKRFWLMSQCVDRIEAQRAIRSLTVAVSSQSNPQECRDALFEEVGTTATGSAERDEDGFANLKKLSVTTEA